MAGRKGSKSKGESSKKRKRELNEGETKSKRHRQQDGQDEIGRHPDSSTVENKLVKADSLLEPTSNGPQQALNQLDEPRWRISKPMGGRMLNIDPILTADDQHLILTFNTSVQVYDATNSLLLRRISVNTIEASSETSKPIPAAIIATRQSTHNPHLLWVACSDGQVYQIDWRQDAEARPAFRTLSKTAKAMAVAPAEHVKDGGDIILIMESNKSGRMELVAYQPKPESAPASKSLLVLKNPGKGLQLLEISPDGAFLTGVFHDHMFMGAKLRDAKATKFGHLHYEFISFDGPDLISSIDLGSYPRSSLSGANGLQADLNSDPIVNVVAGGARGGIYVYHDALAHVREAGKSQSPPDGIRPQKHHWHRRAVHSVKWSRDGNYFISGGSENVLVIWQVDTSKKDFLPHLSGSVENIVVSASGSSYVLHLDDNSAMIISTAEMKPTAYVSGLQSAALEAATPKDLLVRRVWSAADQVRRPIPAAIRPSDRSRLHVCVGNGRQATMSGDLSTPLLQSFDLETFSSISKQALARTQPTDVNLTNKGQVIDEPLISHISFSSDGKWLASVDEWTPPRWDVDKSGKQLGDQFLRERREVYLKFWQYSEENRSVGLVSRVNSPHATSFPEPVLDLASDPKSTCFATIGADCLVRLWKPRNRQDNDVPSKDPSDQAVLYWTCSRAIPVGECVGKGKSIDEVISHSNSSAKAQGRLTFSEDGSAIFAAFGAGDSGAVYIIEAESGLVVKMLEGLWSGQLHAIGALSSFVIILSDELRVHDVVGDELRYGMTMPKIPDAKDLLQLAVDRSSGHFAVTLPVGKASSIGVFDPERAEPLLVRSAPHRIVSLVSTPDASGFVAIDDAAQIWIISEGSDPLAVATARPLEDLELDASDAMVEDGPETAVVDFPEPDMGSGEESDEQSGEEEEDVEMEDGTHMGVVIPQQRLADIFDAAPAFAAPSVEDMFYKVTSLLSTKPLSAATA